MFNILMWVFLCCVSCTVCVQNMEEPMTDQPLLTTPFAINDKPTVAEQGSKNPINENDVKPEIINVTPEIIQNESNDLNHRVVTYDQRQEGQYNIRADLENFMIVLIPQNPSEGLNILDILTRSSTKGNKFMKTNTNKRFHPKFRPQVEPTQQSFNFINRQPSISLMTGNQKKISDLIEGRTPYKVDLSSEGDFGQIHTNQPVDVLPPPYPLAYQLLKPYHLEAEPNIVQAVKHQQNYNNPEKVIKAIKLNYNHSDKLNNLRLSKTINDPFYDEYAHDGLDEVLSKTVDLKLVDEDYSLNSNEENIDYNVVKKSMDDIVDNPSWEIRLIGSTENCGLGVKRDSYGICRFLNSYN